MMQQLVYEYIFRILSDLSHSVTQIVHIVYTPFV